MSITTNGTILNESVKKVLEGLRAHIVVSIDALEAENYERIRVNTKFAQVMEHIEYFRESVKRKHTGLTFAV